MLLASGGQEDKKKDKWRRFGRRCLSGKWHLPFIPQIVESRGKGPSSFFCFDIWDLVDEAIFKFLLDQLLGNFRVLVRAESNCLWRFVILGCLLVLLCWFPIIPHVGFWRKLLKVYPLEVGWRYLHLDALK